MFRKISKIDINVITCSITSFTVFTHVNAVIEISHSSLTRAKRRLPISDKVERTSAERAITALFLQRLRQLRKAFIAVRFQGV